MSATSFCSRASMRDARGTIMVLCHLCTRNQQRKTVTDDTWHKHEHMRLKTHTPRGEAFSSKRTAHVRLQVTYEHAKCWGTLSDDWTSLVISARETNNAKQLLVTLGTNTYYMRLKTNLRSGARRRIETRRPHAETKYSGEAKDFTARGCFFNSAG